MSKVGRTYTVYGKKAVVESESIVRGRTILHLDRHIQPSPNSPLRNWVEVDEID